MNIKFHEPFTIDELDSLFRLRQGVYSQDANLNTMVSQTSRCDINQFDLHALHFAAFDGETPIAYIRITTSNETRFTNWVKEILVKNNIKIEFNSASFPFQSYYPDSNWSANFVAGLQGKKVGEVGKLAIHKDYRRGGTVLAGLIDAFMHYCNKEPQIEMGFGLCMLSLQRYYRKFGFTQAKGTLPFTYKGLPEAVMLKFDNGLIAASYK